MAQLVATSAKVAPFDNIDVWQGVGKKSYAFIFGLGVVDFTDGDTDLFLI